MYESIFEINFQETFGIIGSTITVRVNPVDIVFEAESKTTSDDDIILSSEKGDGLMEEVD